MGENRIMHDLYEENQRLKARIIVDLYKENKRLKARIEELEEKHWNECGQIVAPRLGSIEEYHYELAKCKTAFWSCNRRCMNAEEQYRRKADELRKAQEQIAEYKRLLKAAVEDFPDLTDMWRYANEALALIGEDTNVPASADDTNVGHKSSKTSTTTRS